MWPWGACWLPDEACEDNVSAFEGFEACTALANGRLDRPEEAMDVALG